jgi:Uma2 family endonuclease
MTIASNLLTADELFASPQYEKHCELVNGELIMMAPAGGEHGELAINIGAPLTTFIRKNKLGRCLAAETGFIIARNPDTVRSPDFAFIPQDRVPPEGISEKFLTLIPALVVEVLSPHDQAIPVTEKIEDWLRFGVDQVWILNPKLKTLTVHTPTRDPHTFRTTDTLDATPILPGFTLPFADLFSL